MFTHLLPKWRGAAPSSKIYYEMDNETGISIMKIIPELDAGPYYLTKKDYQYFSRYNLREFK